MLGPEAIAEALCAGLRRADARARREQAVRGVDALSEVELHPLAAAALRAQGWSVLREQPYPSQWQTKRSAAAERARRRAAAGLPERHDRWKCDLVLVERAATGTIEDAGPGEAAGRIELIDTLERARAMARDQRERAGTLFEAGGPAQPVSAADERVLGSAAAPGDGPPGVRRISAGEALWLELKVVGQFCYVEGVPGPNRQYASQLVRGVALDVAKLASDDAVERGAAGLVLFAVDAEVIRHDLTQLAHRLLDRQLPVRAFHRAVTTIDDRIGNRAAGVCVIEVGRGPGAGAGPGPEIGERAEGRAGQRR